MSDRPDYYDMMHRPVTKGTRNRLEERYGKFETESTFVKPYGDDEYPEMEYFYPGWPPWMFPEDWWPYPQLPEELYPDFSSERCGPCSISCHGAVANKDCDENIVYGWCHVAHACFTGSHSEAWAQYNWDISGDAINTIEYFETGIMTGKVGSGGSSVKIYPDWDSIESVNDRKEAKFYVTFTDGVGNICKEKLTIACKETCCPAETALSYDDANADTIVRETSETLTITGGCAPYSWSVTGTGFSLAYSSTENKQNDLTADDTACGTATISVTDDCGTSVTGYVRCTTGGWTEKSTGVCEMSGTGTLTGTSGASGCCMGWHHFELIIDNKKQLQSACRTGGCGVTDCNTLGICPAYCDGQNEYCCGDPVPSNCIDPDPSWYPYRCVADGHGGWTVQCRCPTSFAYYEWECV